jgi:hypothetical protein
MLAKRLGRYLLELSGAALAVMLSQQAASAAAPAGVLSATIKAASLFAAGNVGATGALSIKAIALTQGVLQMMLLAKRGKGTVGRSPACWGLWS